MVENDSFTSSPYSSILTIAREAKGLLCTWTYRRLQSTVHYCNILIFILGSLLGTISYIIFTTYLVNMDADIIVRAGFILASVISCLLSLVGSGSELKSSHVGLVLSSTLGLFVLILLGMALFVSINNMEEVYVSVESELERGFLNASKHFLYLNSKDMVLTHTIARTMKRHECCGWYWPEELCNATACPGACCPKTPIGAQSQKWTTNCSQKNRFKDVCFDKMTIIHKNDLVIMVILAILMVPLIITSTVCTFELARFAHELD